jgi:hypothetical protein
MIYLFAGNDTKSKRKAYEKFCYSQASLESFSVIKNDFDQRQVESFYSGSGLFFEKCAVYFKNVFENQDAKEFILNHISEMSESPNIFVFLEGHLPKSELDIFKKNRAELDLFEMPKEKMEKYDNFKLANAYAARDKLNLWIFYRQAVEKGVRLEELVGVLFWKAKDMLLKKNLRHFSEVELRDFTSKISYILPKARAVGESDEVAMEQFLLGAV